MARPEIKVKRMWSSESVRIACIRNDLYTCGDCKDYSQMLNSVDSMEPTVENLYLIAKDIKDHSDDQTIGNVMFILEKMAVTTIYEIEGEE